MFGSACRKTDDIFYCLIFQDCPSWKANSLCLYPAGKDGPVISPYTEFPFRSSYNSQRHSARIQTLLHAGMLLGKLKKLRLNSVVWVTFLFLSCSSSIVLTRLSGPRSRPTTSQKSCSSGNRTRTSASVARNSDPWITAAVSRETLNIFVYYNRQSIGQSILLSDTYMGPITWFSLLSVAVLSMRGHLSEERTGL
jgi:hypothetical protein